MRATAGATSSRPDGASWTIDLLIDGEYATEQAVDPQPAPTLDEAKRMAQEWESGLW